MKKKTFKIVLLISIAVLIAGIVLIIDKGSGIKFYNNEINHYGTWEWISYESYLRDCDYLEKYTAWFNFGIVMTVLGGISLLVEIIIASITKSKKSILDNIDTYMD